MYLPIPAHQWHKDFKEKGVTRGEMLERRGNTRELREGLLALTKPQGWTLLVAESSVTFSTADRKLHIKANADMSIFVEQMVGKNEWKSEKEKYRNPDEVINRVKQYLETRGVQ